MVASASVMVGAVELFPSSDASSRYLSMSPTMKVSPALTVSTTSTRTAGMVTRARACGLQRVVVGDALPAQTFAGLLAGAVVGPGRGRLEPLLGRHLLHV